MMGGGVGEESLYDLDIELGFVEFFVETSLSLVIDS